MPHALGEQLNASGWGAELRCRLYIIYTLRPRERLGLGYRINGMSNTNLGEDVNNYENVKVFFLLAE